MSEENKNTTDNENKENPESTEEKKPINFDDDKEPIDSIEKTVENLKKRIQEISAEDESDDDTESDSADIPSFANNEAKDRMNEMKNDAVNMARDSYGKLKGKAASIDASENFRKTVDYVMKNAVKAVDTAKLKINEFAENPDVKRTMKDAGDNLKKAGEYAGSKAQEAGRYISDHMDTKTKENLQNAANTAGQAVNDTARKAVTAVNDFVQKPEVQETISKVRENAADLADKGQEAIGSFFDSRKNVNTSEDSADKESTSEDVNKEHQEENKE